MADEQKKKTIIVFNLTGRGDKELSHVHKHLGDQKNG